MCGSGSPRSVPPPTTRWLLEKMRYSEADHVLSRGDARCLSPIVGASALDRAAKLAEFLGTARALAESRAGSDPYRFSRNTRDED